MDVILLPVLGCLSCFVVLYMVVLFSFGRFCFNCGLGAFWLL